MFQLSKQLQNFLLLIDAKVFIQRSLIMIQHFHAGLEICHSPALSKTLGKGMATVKLANDNGNALNIALNVKTHFTMENPLYLAR